VSRSPSPSSCRCLVVWALLSASVLAAPSPPAPNRAAEREALKKALVELAQRGPLKQSRLGVQILSLDDGSVVWSKDAEALMNPASNVKLVTAAAALFRLGPEYRFDTEFLVEPGGSPDHVKTLWVRGKGDPSLSTERLYAIVSELQHLGLREVGEIILDDSWFDGERLAPGFEQEVSDRAYTAPTGAISLNANAVGVYLRAPAPGARAVVEMEPASEYFEVVNGAAGTSSRARRASVNSEWTGTQQRITVRGTVPVGGDWAVWKRIDNPPLYFGYTFKRLLEQRGIRVRGKVKLGVVPERARLLHVSESETFDLILKRMNKYSSNFVAEQLLKTLGAEGKGPPGSTAGGVQVAEEFLEREIGIARGSYIFKNGSGLNDTNRFTAGQLAKLLKYMWDRFPLAPEYLSSIGIAGKDGTLRYRFEGSEAVGRLRAKTGTLENVSALTGYVQAVGGERFAFSVMVNDYPGRSSPVVQGIDAIGAAVAASGTPGGPGRAVAALTQPTPGGLTAASNEEAKTRIQTYLAVAQKADQRNLAFLRTAWRNERDAAVRAVVADSIYQSDPRDYLGSRALLDSFTATDEVYGRLRKLSRELKTEVPCVGSLTTMAAEGNGEALSRLVELARASSGDSSAQKTLSTALGDVSKTAPDELLVALRAAPATDRDAALVLLARGVAQQQDADHPLWASVRKMMASTDPETATFARGLETTLSQRMAAEKAPHPAPVAPAAVTVPSSVAPAGSERPGG
jgi:D-alanyl-D-alanine carboxypeptidase/D-alanyl-D-alanine-endopeptidase (penicillin-binding protein 4)